MRTCAAWSATVHGASLRLAPKGIKKRRITELLQPWLSQPKNPLNTQQMQRVIQCMTNKVATLGTVVKQCFGMVIRGKRMGQDQAGICVCVGWGSWPHHGARLAFLSKYQHIMHG